MNVCSCGHRVGIHEYPYACKGAVDWPDGSQTRCDCNRLIEWDDIAQDRELIDKET